ncbi:MAG TPA: PQQ-binding-like beta-propeller repeat protein [Candidatus Aquilonibacter sp.]|nr:PQQ-binding-like beta-propeller repeat protein [Candidatus Aquilonibacter sp.]
MRTVTKGATKRRRVALEMRKLSRPGILALVLLGASLVAVIAAGQAALTTVPPAVGAEGVAKSATSAPINITPSDLMKAPVASNWASYNGDYTGRRYSGLTQINKTDVGSLAAQWVFHVTNSDRLEMTPEVVDGVMFVTAANDCYAIDARTGRLVWHYSQPITQGLIDDASSHHNRGVGIWHDRVFMETDNAHLLSLDVRSGNLIWDVAYANTTSANYGATSSPLVLKDEVLVGTSGGDDGVRGFLVAFDAKTGKELWRFWTIPGPGEFGNESWPGDMYLHGGGTAWMPGTYDPTLNTLYWGTGNPAPDFYGEGRPGDDLYTDCVIALDPDTGKLKWYYQFTPHDLNDYDSVETPVLVDTIYQGRPRKLIVEANRNGFVYVLDRTNGKFLSAIPFTDNVNWAKSIGADGRPVKTGVIPGPDGTEVCPSYGGATNWYSPTYNAGTGLFYFLGNNGCNVFVAKPQDYAYGDTYYATGTRRVPGEQSTRWLMAYDPRKNTFVWRYPQVGRGGNSGVMSTAGGLLFFGDDADSLEAVDARTGHALWHFDTGQSFTASPMTYALKGRQYVAVAAGDDVFSFALPQSSRHEVVATAAK